RSLRKVRGLSQADLALRLGVTQSRIAAIERNPAVVSAGQLLDLLKALGVDLVLRDTSAPGAASSPTSYVSDTGPQGAW
ncbi:MAG: helix-turn-helix transcriptional regulator, partial [Desulfobacterales bacterium]|nr:helix-turn-helix transcriptional regulator [Desulfobacterales bacterium]